MAADVLVVPARCNGPRASGNGGWTAGALAQRLDHDGPVTVRLMLPPPLETDLDVVRDGDGVRLEREGTAVATAAPGSLPSPPPARRPVSLAEATDASTHYAGHRRHPFPTCLSCGPERAEGDGLRIFPGRLPDGRVAAPWHAHDVDVPLTWAALDCVGGWSSDIEHRPMVLGQMSAEIVRLPTAGETYVVVGEEVAVEGRKARTRSELLDDHGHLLARAEHVWIQVDPEIFNSLE